ncbi:MAG: WhiB family transcriptional regulator [Pseudonocardia sp.]|nr:WhiB family transcriptional regulator [Pseudonocardia sp.]
MRGIQHDRHRGKAERCAERLSASPANKARTEHLGGADRVPHPPEAVRTPCAEADPDLWFAERPSELSVAKALCAHCPIKAACLAGALDRGEPWGVWGGEIVQQGVVLAYKRGRGRPSNADRGLGLVTRIADTGAEGVRAGAPGRTLRGSGRARRPAAVTRPDTAETFRSRSA